MRPITKQQSYSNRALDGEDEKGKPTSAEEATKRWHRFKKEQTFKQLLIEQFGLRSNTELNIQDFCAENQSVKGAHIEHITPKSRFYGDTFEYHNLLLSVLDDEDLIQFKKQDRFGGHFKASNYEAHLFISPLDPQCRRYFSYSTENGEIFAVPRLNEQDKAKAQYTIELLNLNVGYLKNKRKK